MDDPLQYAYIDESGSVSVSRHTHLLIVAALCTDDSQNIARMIRRVKKKYGTSLSSGEFKAKKTSVRAITQILTALSAEPIEIFAVVVNPQIIGCPPKDPEDIYRWAVTRTVAMLVERHPRLEIVLDRRYTKENLRYRLEKAIRSGISGLPQHYVLVRQEDSTLSKELQAVDFIAWSFLQKYERSDSRFYDLIAPRIVLEECMTKQIWETEKKTGK